MLNSFFALRNFRQMCAVEAKKAMKTKTEGNAGHTQNTSSVPLPKEYHVYTAVAQCEQQLSEERLQSDEEEEGQDPLAHLEEMLSSLPTIYQGRSFAPEMGFISSGGFAFGDDVCPEETIADENDGAGTSHSGLDLNLIESALILIRQVWRSRDFEDFAIAVLQFLKAYTGRSACSMFATVVANCVTMFRERGGTVQSGESEEDSNPFTRLRELMESATSLTKHPLLNKFRKVMWYLLSFATLTKLGISFDNFFYSQAEQEALSRKHDSKTGFMVAILDSFVTLLERLVDCYRTGSWSPLVASGTAYAAWSDSVYDLRNKSQQLHNPEACGFSYPQFLGELEDALEKGRAIVKYETDKSIANGMKKMLSELEMIKATECTKKAARASRDAPFSILYYGGSSIAKTTLQDLTHVHFAKTHALPQGDEYKYTRTCSDEYYSGFMTQMWSIIVDDIANLNPNLGLDPSMGELLQLRNNASFCPPQADLNDKGKTPVLCQLLQASTNTKDLNAYSYYCNTLAIMRRWNYIVTITLKGEFSQLINGVIPEPNLRMIDGSKIPLLRPGDYPDLWDFVVEKVVADVDSASGKQYPKYEPVFFTSSIYEYLAFVSRESTIFRAQQKQIKQGVAIYSKVVLCPECHFPNWRCTCLEEVQSKETTAAGLGTIASLLSIYFLGPKVRKKVVDATSKLVTDIGRKAAQNLMREAENVVAPKLIEVLRTEGYLPPEPQPDPEVEELEARLLDMEMPVAPKASWFETIQTRVNSMHLPLVERLAAERQWVGAQMRRFGEKARRLHHTAIGDPVFGVAYQSAMASIAGMGAVLGMVAIGGWIFARPAKKKGKGKTQSAWVDGAENFDRDEKVNPWYRDEYVPSKFDYTPLTTSWKSLPREQVLDRVQRNVLFVKSSYVKPGFGDREFGKTFRILGLEGNLYVTNSHNIPVDLVEFNVMQNPTQPGINDQFTVVMHPGDFYRVPEKDLVFFTLRHIPPKASISGLLTTESFRTTCEGTMVSRAPDGSPEKFSLRAMHNSVEYDDAVGDIVGYRAECEIITQSGQCGSPYIGFPGVGPVLLGLHIIGGTTNSVVCVSVSMEDLKAARIALKFEAVQAGVPDLTDEAGRDIELLPLHKKSTFRFIDEGCAEVYGSLPGVRIGGKSKVEKTLIHEEMLEAGYTVKVGAPVMKGWKPWRLANIDIVQQKYLIDVPALDKCVDAFTNDIVSRLTPEDLKDVQVLSGRATVNGLPGVQYIDKINRNTSMGFPWNAPKNNYLIHQGQVDMWDDYVEFPPEIYTKVDAMIEKYRNGERCMPIYKNHLKDEVTTLEKIWDEKTRLFAGCPVTFALAMRKYLLGMARCVQKNRFIFEAAPGTNATSLEWCNIYHYLAAFGLGRIVGGDFKKYDKKMNPVMILGAGDVIIGVCRAAGWSEEDIRIVRSMIYDIAFPVVDVNGDLVQFWGSNPSGHPLTVIINSLVNSLYMRYAWFKSGHELHLFQLLVHLLTYGDDNIMGVAKEVMNFDHSVIQRELAKIGVEYTMADKQAGSRPFINLMEASFLKRSFVFSEDVGSFVAQLEHNSIEKGLLYHLPSKVVCTEQLAVDSMYNALQEYFFYGKEKFNERKSVFESVIERKDLGPYFKEFPTYEGLVERYLESSKCYSLDGRCAVCAA